MAQGDGGDVAHATDDGPEGSEHRVRSIALGGVLVLLLAAAWAVTEPQVLREESGLTVTAAVPVGGSMFVGQTQLGERDVVLERVDPVVLGGLQATVWLCRPVPDAEGIGSLSRGEIDDHCDLAPVTPGTVLPGATTSDPGPIPDYLVVELTPTVREPQAFCGLDVTYRDGWRTARQRQATTHKAITNPTDEDGVAGDPLRPLEDCPQPRAD